MRGPSLRRVALALALLCLATSWLVAPARADVTIGAAPSLLEVSATPGGEGSQDLVVSNGGSEPFHVTAEVAQYKNGEGNLSAVAWLSVDPASFELAPGQQSAVKVTIKVPSDLDSGSRFAMVAFRTGGKASEGSAVGVAAQVGVPFLITVNGTGELTHQASLNGLLPVLESNGYLGFRALVANRGNLHFYSKGTVDVARMDDGSGGQVALRESTAILPGAEEMLYSDQPIAFQEGATYQARAVVSSGEATDLVKEVEFPATASLDIEELAPRVTPGGELNVRLRLRNRGGLGLLPRIMMAVRGADGKVAGALSPNAPPLLWPGQSAEIDARYPGKLAPGSYALVARVEFGASSAQQEAPFQIAASKATGSAPISSWAEGTSQQAQATTNYVPSVPALAEQQSPLVAGALVAAPPLAAIFIFLVGISWTRSRSKPSGTLHQAMSAARRFRPTVAGRMARQALAGRIPRPALLGRMPRPALVARMPRPAIAGRAARPALVAPPARTALPPRPTIYLLAPSAQEKTPGVEIDYSGRAQSLQSDAEASAGTASATTDAEQDSSASGAMGEPSSDSHVEHAAALVAQARVAAQSWDMATVSRLSRDAIDLDARNVDAWLWLAASSKDTEVARLCLKTALLLDPENATAKRGLACLEGPTNGRDER